MRRLSQQKKIKAKYHHVNHFPADETHHRYPEEFQGSISGYPSSINPYYVMMRPQNSSYVQVMPQMQQLPISQIPGVQPVSQLSQVPSSILVQHPVLINSASKSQNPVHPYPVKNVIAQPYHQSVPNNNVVPSPAHNQPTLSQQQIPFYQGISYHQDYRHSAIAEKSDSSVKSHNPITSPSKVSSGTAPDISPISTTTTVHSTSSVSSGQ